MKHIFQILIHYYEPNGLEAFHIVADSFKSLLTTLLKDDTKKLPHVLRFLSPDGCRDSYNCPDDYEGSEGLTEMDGTNLKNIFSYEEDELEEIFSEGVINDRHTMQINKFPKLEILYADTPNKSVIKFIGTPFGPLLNLTQ